MSGKKNQKGKTHRPSPPGVKAQAVSPKEKIKGAPSLKKRGAGGFFGRNSFQIALFLLAFVVFGNGIRNEYALDDEFYTAGANKYTQKGFKGIKEIFTTRTFYNNDGSGYSYRPVTLTSFAIEIAIFGEHPHISHFINVLLYALTMVLLFGLLREWFVTQGDWFSFFICLIFLVHPLHTEVVDNIKCRDELLAFFFGILAWKFIMNHARENKPVYLVFAMMAYLIGMLAKHTIIPFIVLTPFILWFFTEQSWKKIVLYTSVFIVAALIANLMQKVMLPAQFREYQIFENPLPSQTTPADRLATAMYVLGRYLWLHIIPHPLVYYYGFRYVPILKWNSVLVILSLLVYAAAGIFALRKIRSKHIAAFGIIFFAVNIAAYSNILLPAPGIMAERFTYAASLGFVIVLVWGVFAVMKKIPLEFRWSSGSFRSIRAVFILIALLMTVRCWMRNSDWKDKMTLYNHDIEYNYESAKANMLLGALTAKNGMQAGMEANGLKNQNRIAEAAMKKKESEQDFLEARAYYKTAADIAPYYHTAWSNLGTTYFFLDDAKTALPYFLKGVSLNKKYTEGLFNCGMAYDRLERKDSAVWYFGEAIRTDSTYVSAYEQLARIKFKQEHDTTGAFALMHIAARKKPDSDVPWNDIATFYLDMRDTAASAAAMEMAAKINPSNINRLNNLAMYYQRKGDYAKYNLYYSMFLEQQKKQKAMQEEQEPQR